MVSDQQVDHYQTFGFLILPRYMDQRETAELSEELDRALRDGYGSHFDDRQDWWWHSLPMMRRQRTPRSLALGEDARFLGAARRLLAAPCCRPMPKPTCCSARPASTPTAAPAPQG